MKHRANVYNKRLIFDHLMKTAGLSVHKWFMDELGAGCVSGHHWGGDHQESIRRFGGKYSIICAHLDFGGEGLDPRYQYITLLREPIDRVISWLFFEMQNVDRGKLLEQDSWRQDFILSDGTKLNNGVLRFISNIYTKHFFAIENKNTTIADSEQVASALSVIKSYDIVGLYEEMPEFLADVADLVSIPAPKSIARVNATLSRPAVDQISPKLRQRIIDLNQLDIRFYNEVVAWKKSQPPKERKTIFISPWQKYEPVGNPAFTTQDIPAVRAKLIEGHDVIHGQLLTFQVDFLLNRQVHELEAGIHIFDENKSWAFGTNSTLQGKSYLDVSAGSHRITHHLIANLPAGKYTAGFAFVERLPEGDQKELAWYDVLSEFSVRYDAYPQFAGYSSLPAEITLQPTTLADNSLIIQEPTGSITPVGMLETMQPNKEYKITVTVSNDGSQLWRGDIFRPVNMSYHWYDQAGNLVLYDGPRTSLPAGGIASSITAEIEMAVQAPASPGRYGLVLTLVQENIGWFEEKGFKPYKVEINVV